MTFGNIYDLYVPKSSIMKWRISVVVVFYNISIFEKCLDHSRCSIKAASHFYSLPYRPLRWKTMKALKISLHKTNKCKVKSKIGLWNRKRTLLRKTGEIKIKTVVYLMVSININPLVVMSFLWLSMMLIPGEAG